MVIVSHNCEFYTYLWENQCIKINISVNKTYILSPPSKKTNNKVTKQNTNIKRYKKEEEENYQQLLSLYENNGNACKPEDL